MRRLLVVGFAMVMASFPHSVFAEDFQASEAETPTVTSPALPEAPPPAAAPAESFEEPAAAAAEPPAAESKSHDWSVEFGLGLMPFGARANVVPGVLDREFMYTLPIGINYQLMPNWVISSGLEFQWYHGTNSNSFSPASFDALALRIPLTINYITEGKVFFGLGAGAALGIPITYKLVDPNGVNWGNTDAYGQYYQRSSMAVQDIIRLQAGLTLSPGVKLKFITDISPISLMSNQVLVSTSYVALPNPSQGYYIGYSPVVMSLRLEMFSF